MRMHVHAVSDAAKMHETRLTGKKTKQNKTKPPPQKTVFALEEKSAVGEGKHFERRLIKCSRRLGGRRRRGAAATETNQQPDAVAASFAPHNGRRPVKNAV